MIRSSTLILIIFALATFNARSFAYSPSRLQLGPQSASTESISLQRAQGGFARAPRADTSAVAQQAEDRLPGSVSGTIVDKTGTAIVGARIQLAHDDGSSPNIETTTGEDGSFSFANVAPGAFHLTIASQGFTTQSTPGLLHSGQACIVPPISLVIATEVTEVKVQLTPVELAQEQLKEQEKQRVLGVIPNFYVTYAPDPAPLSSKQKFGLAWKSTVDPIRFIVVGAIAGGDQATDRFSGYGQGAEGYAKRYGAAYADYITGTFIGGAILPSLFKQDPRYYYKGVGSTRSRFLYAVANAVICKGDNGHWQANYSNILGSLASGGISNLYYPASDRNGAGLTFENALIGIGASAVVNVLQEFVIRKLTPNAPHYATGPAVTP